MAAARSKWLNDAKDDGERAKREASVFLSYASDENVFADFHANWHTFITNLGRSGVSPKLAQTLARHSTIRLTFDIYTHVDQSDQSAAVSTLPSPPTNLSADTTDRTPNASAQGATQHPSQSPQPGKVENESKREHEKAAKPNLFALKFAQIIRGGCHSEAVGVDGTPKRAVNQLSPQTVDLSGVSIDCQQKAEETTSGQGRDRTGDTRIFSPAPTDRNLNKTKDFRSNGSQDRAK